MGIVNKDNALYMATGIDNTGLYSGRREAVGIIKAMAGEITSFDVFGGIGISAGIAFAQAAKGAYDFEKQFQQSMKEVATLSSGIKGSLTDYMNQVVDITREIPVQANDVAKALYQIVSAGHDGADGMKILEVSAKDAIGGVTDTATAADAITTLINAYKLSASDAGRISDQLFTTVKLGKTSFGELGKSIAQAAPIAASYGVEIDQVLAAVATLTKQGTPTAQAMTQIRAAIVGVSKYLGDGAYNGRTFQEALELVRQKAGGSEAKLREFIPEIEAVNGLLGLTGQNATEAAGHLSEMGNSAGAAEAAFKEMASSAQNQLQMLQNNITASLRPMGEAILKEVSDIATSFNEAFDNGDVQRSMETLGSLIVVVTGAFVGYKGSIIATTAAKTAYHAITSWITKQKAIEAANLVLTKGLYAAEATMIAKNTGMHVLLTNALKAQFAASMKAAAAMLTNPYVLAAAAVAGLGYAIYKLATAETEAEKAVRSHNNAIRKQKEYFDNLKKSADDLLSTIRDESSTQFEKIKAYKELQRIMPETLKNLDLETLKTMDLAEARKLLNSDANKQYTMGVKVNAVLKQRDLDAATAEWQKAVDESAYNKVNGIEDQGLSIRIGQLARKKQAAEEAVKLANEEVRKIKEIQKEAQKAEELAKEKASIQNKAYWEKQKDDATEALESIASAQKKQMDAGNFKGIDSKIVENYKKNSKLLKEAEKELKVYDSSSKQDNQAENLRKEVEQYKLLVDKNKREQIRAEKDAEFEVIQTNIDIKQEGAQKILAQRELNHEKELEVIKREAEDNKLAIIEKARGEFEAQENVNAAKNPTYKRKTFNVEEYIKSEPAKKQFVAIDNTAEAKKKASETKYNRGDDLRELIDEYQDFTDQRLAIEKKFNEDIKVLDAQRKTALENGDMEQVAKIDRAKIQADKNRKEDLSSVAMNEFKADIDWTTLFGNLDILSPELLNKLRDKLKGFIETAADKLTPEDLKALSEAMTDVDLTIADKSPYEALKSGLSSYKTATEEAAVAQGKLNKLEKEGKEGTKAYRDATKELNDAQRKRQESLKSITQAANNIGSKGMEVVNAGNQIVDMLGNFGVAVPEAVGATLDGIGQTMSALESIDLTKPFSAITGSIGILTGIGNTIAGIFGFGNKDKKNEKNIQRLQEQIEVLDKTYEKLGDAIEDAYSKDASHLIGQQNEVLEQQKVIIQNQIKEEESKKHSDGGRIKEWQNQIDEIDKQISDNKKKAQDAIFGEDVKSAIDNFAQAYADAWASGEDRSKSAKDVVKNMIKSMVMEMIKSDISGQVQKIRDKIEEAVYGKKSIFGGRRTGGDGKVDDAEYTVIESMVDDTLSGLDRKYAWADKFMKDEDDSSREASQKGIATASQESVDENNGRLTVIQEHTFNLNEKVASMDERLSYLSGYAQYLTYLPNIDRNMGSMADCCNSIVSYLSDIANNTANLIGMKEDMHSMKQDINTVLIKGLKLNK